MTLKTFFFPLAIIITVFVVIWFIVPQWEVVQSKNKEVEAKKEISLSLNNKITKLNQEIVVYDNNSKEATVIYQALPVEVDNDVLIDEIFNGAKNNGTLITKVDVGKIELVKKEANKVKQVVVSDKVNAEKAKPSVYKIPLKLELTGSYIAIKNFIDFIESANRFFAVDSFEIARSNDELNDSVSASVSISCFYKKEDANLELSAVAYNLEDQVFKNLTDGGAGLDTDFIIQHKNSIKNSGYVFNPAIVAGGKNDLFSKSGGGVVVTE